MKKLLFSLLMIGFLFSICHAAIRRVGYNGLPLTGVDYPDVNSAADASNPGDTIQIYGPQTGAISKRLVFIGFGYNFDVNTGLQAIGSDQPSGLNIQFDPGSENSIVEGCFGIFYFFASNITINRCYATMYIYNNNNSVNNIKVTSSVFTGGGMVYTTNTCTNFQMYNCLLMGTLNFYLNGSSGSIINCAGGPPSIVGQPSYLNLNGAGFLVKNSILPGYGPSNINTIYENNFFNSAQPSTLPQGSNNRWSQSWSNLFNRLGGVSDDPGYYNYPVFTENYYILKVGSLAINGGFDASNNATDCGIYGGELSYRYKLSGVPAVPAINLLTAPGSAATTNPYNVTISVKSNN